MAIQNKISIPALTEYEIWMLQIVNRMYAFRYAITDESIAANMPSMWRDRGRYKRVLMRLADYGLVHIDEKKSGARYRPLCTPAGDPPAHIHFKTDHNGHRVFECPPASALCFDDGDLNGV